MQSPEAEIAAMMARLRTPLSRIELAASQLLRSAPTPGVRALSAGISDAVAEIDEQIAVGLQALVGCAPASSPPEDCRPVIHELHRRIEPVLQARGIEWTVPLEVDPAAPVMGSRQAARGAALALLQCGMELADSGGRIALSLEPDAEAERYGVVLRVRRDPGPGDARELHSSAPRGSDAFAAPRGFARANGGELEIRDEPESLGAVVWIDTEAAVCAS